MKKAWLPTPAANTVIKAKRMIMIMKARIVIPTAANCTAYCQQRHRAYIENEEPRRKLKMKNT